MVMENWKFLINRLIIFLGMIGSFMGATFGYSSLLIKIMGESMFLALLGFEFLILCLFGIIFLLVLIDYIKDNKKRKN
jgi:hypothetical protein